MLYPALAERLGKYDKKKISEAPLNMFCPVNEVDNKLTVLSAEAQDTCENRYPAQDTKLHLVVRFQFWRLKEFRVHFHGHYSQVHTEPEG